MIDLRSTIIGIWAMKKDHGKVNYRLFFKLTKKPWFEMYTPIWHEGRGPYISLSFFFFRFYRGY